MWDYYLIILNDRLSLARAQENGADNADLRVRGRTDMKCSGWFALRRAVVLPWCGTLILSCSQAPPEPAPDFTLPLSRVTAAPPSPEQAAETGSAPSRLRYVAVPPGHQVAGMVHARIVVKQKKTIRHRPRHARKKAVSPATAVKTLTETAEPISKR